jgi:hypothetical protein
MSRWDPCSSISVGYALPKVVCRLTLNSPGAETAPDWCHACDGWKMKHDSERNMTFGTKHVEIAALWLHTCKQHSAEQRTWDQAASLEHPAHVTVILLLSGSSARPR